MVFFVSSLLDRDFFLAIALLWSISRVSVSLLRVSLHSLRHLWTTSGILKRRTALPTNIRWTSAGEAQILIARLMRVGGNSRD